MKIYTLIKQSVFLCLLITVLPLYANTVLKYQVDGHFLAFAKNKVITTTTDFILVEQFINAQTIMPYAEPDQQSKEKLKKVTYHNLWQGINLYYQGSENGISESFWEITPQTKVNQIQVHYNLPFSIQKNGSLHFQNPNKKGWFSLSAPKAWQNINQQKIPVQVAFTQIDQQTLGYELGKYNSQYKVIIDPVLNWNTFSGYNQADVINGLTIDSTGNIYTVGNKTTTFFIDGSPDFVPLIEVKKFNSDGVLLWSFVDGGRSTTVAFSSRNRGSGIVVDNNGVYVTGGSSHSWGTPLLNHSGGINIVVFRLKTTDGTLVWNTFLGDSATNDATGYAIAELGNLLYVVGESDTNWNVGLSNTPPLIPHNTSLPNSDIVTVALRKTGIYQWHTFSGGPEADAAFGVTVGSNNDLYLTGISTATWDANHPSPNPSTAPIHAYSQDSFGIPAIQDIVVVKLNSLTGDVDWHTFYGSGSQVEGDSGNAIAINTTESPQAIYIVGSSDEIWKQGEINPINNHMGGGANDIFALKLDVNGAFQWNTFHGSTNTDIATSISINSANNIIIGGFSSEDWGDSETPHSLGSFDFDLVALKLNPSGQLLWHTFNGSINNDLAYAIGVTSTNDIYLAGSSETAWQGLSPPINAHTAGLNQDAVLIKLSPADYGDLPSLPFGGALRESAARTLNGTDPARHLITSLFLGTSIDAEDDGHPTIDADGDDIDGTDDEDGVTFGTLLIGTDSSITVVASAAGQLNAWIDTDQDDILDTQVFTDQAVTAGSNSLLMTIPASSVSGTAYVRFRISSILGLGSTGLAADGEVEDYVVNFARQNQTITFNSLPNKTIGDSSFTISATSSSGLAVSFTNDTPTTCDLTGTTITLLMTGTCTITADQAGNGVFNAAASVSQSFFIKDNQTITFNPIFDRVLVDPDFVIGATSDSGLVVSFTSTTPLICSITINTIHLIAQGTCTIAADQAGSDSYNPATTVEQSFVIKLLQTITFNAIPDKALGDPIFAINATSDSGLTVSFASESGGTCSVSGNMVTLIAIGTCTIRASQAGNAVYEPAETIPQDFLIKTPQVITFNPLADQTIGDIAFTVSASSDSGLAVSFSTTTTSICTVGGNTVTLVATGNCIITASQAGNGTFSAATPVNQAFTVNKKSQRITFNPLPDKTFGDADFNVSASSDSGLAVSFNSITSLICTLSGSIVTLVTAGSCTISASQSGNSEFDAAIPVNQSFMINKKNQTITFNALSDKTLGDANFAISASSDSGLAVVFTSTTLPICTILGNTISLVASGTCTITASQAGNTSFNAATPVNQSFMVNKQNQTITFNALPDKTLGDANFTISASSDSGLTVLFTSTSLSICTISGNTISLVASGTCNIRASQAGNASFNAAPSISQSFMVNKQNQTITFNSLSTKTLGDADFSISASSDSGLTITFTSNTLSTCTIATNTISLVSEETCTITASQDGNASFNAATPVNQSFTINKRNQIITFNSLIDKTLGDSNFIINATSDSGLIVSFTSTSLAACTVLGNNVILGTAGLCTITALQVGNASFNAALPVSQSFRINKQDQIITFNALVDKNLADPSFNISATSDSGLAVTFTSLTPLICSVSTGNISLILAGSCTIEAAQAGDSTFNSAIPVNQSFTVNKLIQTITFNSLINKTLGDADFDITATSDSGLTVSFISTTLLVCSITGQTITLIADGTCTITASQVGDASYNFAETIDQSFLVKLNQIITFNTLIDKTLDDGNFTLSATSSSGLTVVFTSTIPSICSLTGNTVVLIAAGTCSISASQDGNSTYNPATPVIQSFTIKLTQIITFNVLTNKTLGDADFTVTATSSSSLTVDFSTLSTSCNVTLDGMVSILSIGNCTLIASQAGDATYQAAIPVNQSFVINTPSKLDQIISFAPLADKIYNDPDFTISATSNSGLTVSFSSDTPTICTISSNTIHLVITGICSITASQAGNSSFNAATDIQQSFNINPQSQIITFNALSNKILGEADFIIGATSDSGLAVSFISNTTSTCLVTINNVHLIAAGTCTISASQAGNAFYESATDVVQSFTITPKLDQVITFNALSDKVLDEADFTITASSDSGLSVSFITTTPLICGITTNLVNIISAGNCSITASEAGNISFNPALDVIQSFTVNKKSQIITFNPLLDKILEEADFSVSASSNSGLTVNITSTTNTICDITGNTVSLITAGLCTLNASQDGDTSFNPALPVSQSFTINKKNQTITFNALIDKTLGIGDFTLSASSDSGLTVNFSSITPSTCTISGNTITLISAGNCTINTSQAGNSIFNPATSINQSFTINKKNQIITFGSLINKIIGDSNFTINASSDSGLAISFTSATPLTCSITGNTVQLLATGGCTTNAEQAGNGSFNPATTISQSFSINKKNQIITFNPLIDKIMGDSNFILSATSDSGLIISFASSTPLICSIAGTTVSLLTSGNCIISASQAGNSTFNATEIVNQSFNINKKNQIITFNTLIDQTIGAANFTISATSDSGLAVSFSSTTPLTCQITGNTITLITAGGCTINASQLGDSTFNSALAVAQSFTINKKLQVISFDTLINKTLGETDFSINATSDSGLPVSFTSITPLICTISGNNITLVAAGACTMSAIQAGDDTFDSALPVNQSFTVNKKAQAITFDTLINKTMGDADFTVNAISDSGLTVSFSSLTPLICSITGTTVSLLSDGNCTLSASQAGDDTYKTANSVEQSFTIKLNQIITFNALSDKTLGDTDFTISATSDSGLTVSFVSTTPATCSVSTNTITLIIAGSCTIKASQAGNASYSPAIPVENSFAINLPSKLDQTISFNTLTDKTYNEADFTITATSDSGLVVHFISNTLPICTITGNTIHLVSIGLCQITASQAGNSTYNAAANIQQGFNVNKIVQNISFSVLPNKTLGDIDFTISASSDSGLPVSFISNTNTTCTISGNTIHLIAEGNCTILASQAGNDFYEIATDVPQSFAINSLTKLDQVISFDSLAPRTYGEADFTISASSDSDLIIIFISNSPIICTVSGNTVHLVAAGDCQISAGQAGNSQYNAAASIEQMATINPKPLDIKGLTIDNKVYDGGNNATLNGLATLIGIINTDTVSLTGTPSATFNSADVGNNIEVAVLGYRLTGTNQNNYRLNSLNLAANISQAPQIISNFVASPVLGIVGNTSSLSALGGASGNVVSFDSLTTSICFVTGSIVNFIQIGACTVSANQSGNANYQAAAQETLSITVENSSIIIPIPPPAVEIKQPQFINGLRINPNIVSIGDIGSISFTSKGGSGNPVIYASLTPITCALTGDQVSFVAEGTCTISANQAGNSAYFAAQQEEVSITVIIKGDGAIKAVLFDKTTGITDENGTTAIFKVSLTSRPNTNIIIEFVSSNPNEGQVAEAVNLISLTFTPDNWNIPQELVIKGVDDKVYDKDIPYTVVSNEITTGDYAGVNPDDLELINLDKSTLAQKIQATKEIVGDPTILTVTSNKEETRLFFRFVPENTEGLESLRLFFKVIQITDVSADIKKGFKFNNHAEFEMIIEGDLRVIVKAAFGGPSQIEQLLANLGFTLAETNLGFYKATSKVNESNPWFSFMPHFIADLSTKSEIGLYFRSGSIGERSTIASYVFLYEEQLYEQDIFAFPAFWDSLQRIAKANTGDLNPILDIDGSVYIVIEGISHRFESSFDVRLDEYPIPKDGVSFVVLYAKIYSQLMTDNTILIAPKVKKKKLMDYFK